MVYVVGLGVFASLAFVVNASVHAFAASFGAGQLGYAAGVLRRVVARRAGQPAS